MNSQETSGTLEMENGHVVHYSCHGNPQGPPVLSFHGGPGSKSEAKHANRFDLNKYRVILFDQRGCGKSTPSGETQYNTTMDTLSDAERIRERLGIDSWFVSGTSWGATLSLLYPIHHPSRVRGILASSLFLADRDTVSWAMENPLGVARLVPDIWKRRMDFFNRFGIRLETQNADIHRLLSTATYEKLKQIAAGIMEWESNISSVQTAFSPVDAEDVTGEDIASVRIFVHYELHQAFLPDNFIMDNLSKVAHIPAVFIHGRYDILCPMHKPFEVSANMQDAELVVVTSSGHSFDAEGETIRRLAHDRFLAKHS